MSLRILVAEEEDTFRSDIARALEGYDVHEVTSGEEAVEALRRDPFPLVITNLNVGDACGLSLMQEAKSLDPQALVVVTVDDPGAPDAVQALRSGAYDYLPKACESEMIAAVLRRAVERIELIRENQDLLSSLKRNVEAFGFQNRRLEHMATRDGLTGLFNYRYFCEAFELELGRSRRHERRMSLVFADLDFFKKYNDTQGHPAGDALLKTLAELITNASRKSTVVARYGGEEFVLLVPETNHAGVLQYAEKLRSLVEAHPFPGRDALPGGRVTMSFGVATFPENGQDANALLKYADAALYRAKNSGRNRVSG